MAGGDLASSLVPSGGATREKAGNLSEGESLKNLIEYEGYFGHPDLRERMLAEVYARDSFENLLFGICCFWITTPASTRSQSRWSAGSSSESDSSCTGRTLRWNREFRYAGVNHPQEGSPLSMALHGESLKVKQFQRTRTFRVRNWQAQREAPNPFAQQHPYRDLVPGSSPFFDTSRRSRLA